MKSVRLQLFIRIVSRGFQHVFSFRLIRPLQFADVFNIFYIILLTYCTYRNYIGKNYFSYLGFVLDVVKIIHFNYVLPFTRQCCCPEFYLSLLFHEANPPAIFLVPTA
jgi:hypothetical protein